MSNAEMTHFRDRADPRTELLMNLPGVLDVLTPHVKELDAAMAKHVAAKRKLADARARVDALEAERDQQTACAAEAEAQARKARRDALIRGEAPPRDAPDQSKKLQRLAEDAELLKSALTELEADESRAHLAYSHAWQAFRRAVHEPLNSLWQSRSKELGLLAAAVKAIRGSDCEAGLHRDFRIAIEGAAPGAEPSDVAKFKPSWNGAAGAFGIDVLVPEPDASHALRGKAWLEEIAELVRSNGARAAAE